MVLLLGEDINFKLMNPILINYNLVYTDNEMLHMTKKNQITLICSGSEDGMIKEDRIVNEFCKLVSIDSPTFGERKMADYLKEELLSLGFTVMEDTAGEKYGSNCGNVYGYLPGRLKGEPLLFSAHMDTVEPSKGKKAIVGDDGTITSDGTTVLGADDVSGIVGILEALRVIHENKLPHRSIEVLFPIAEESYLLGSNEYNFNEIKSKEAYVLDLSGPVGLAALKAPTLVSFTAIIKGKAAHAGFAPQDGIHAIKIGAKAITLIDLGRVDDEMTVNVGIMEGGVARNIVPDSCIIKGEVRSLTHEKAVGEAERIKNIFMGSVKDFGAACDYETSFGCIAYEVEEAHPVVQRFQKVCKELDYETRLVTTCGGSDNNNFMLHGITGIVIACGMNQVHSCNEYTTIEELKRISNIVLGLMTREE